MSLEVAPEIESTVREVAAIEGISVNDLLARYFPPRVVQSDPRLRVQALLSQWQKQDNTPIATPAPNDGTLSSSEALFRQWDEEDAALTDAEQDEQATPWEQFLQGINSERAVSGMRSIF